MAGLLGGDVQIFLGPEERAFAELGFFGGSPDFAGCTGAVLKEGHKKIAAPVQGVGGRRGLDAGQKMCSGLRVERIWVSW